MATPRPRAHAHISCPRSVLRALVAAVAVALVGVVPATHAYATPNPAEIEKQIDAAWAKLEPVIEQYNKVHSQLKANQKKSTELQKRIQPLSLRVDLALVRVDGIASEYYKGGPLSAMNAILLTGSPTTLVDQLTLLDRLAASERRQIASVAAVKAKFDAQKRTIDALVATLKKQDAELAARKRQINAEMASLQVLLRQAYGSTTSGGALRIGSCPAVYPGGPAGVAVKTACAQIGDPYVWGANGPNSFDCSGLTQYSWRAAGVSLTHYTGAQWGQGTAVSRANARAGDLVFFYSDLHHVGMYVGNGLMVHASHPGVPVKMAYIDSMPVAGFRRVG
ncbi:MAG TPA: NlpC/P60 family protein [Micromonosporaceae bacterium]